MAHSSACDGPLPGRQFSPSGFLFRSDLAHLLLILLVFRSLVSGTTPGMFGVNPYRVYGSVYSNIGSEFPYCFDGVLFFKMITSAP